MNDATLDDHDELKDHVLRLTYERMLADHAQHPGCASAPWQRPRRFVSRGALTEARSLIHRACDEADADSQLAEFFTTHWLRQFEPRLA